MDDFASNEAIYQETSDKQWEELWQSSSPITEPRRQGDGTEDARHQRWGHLDVSSTGKMQVLNPPAPNIPSGTNMDGRLLPIREQVRTPSFDNLQIGEMVDASGNRSTDMQFRYGNHALQERFLASYGASTKKTIIQVYPHERDTRLKDELPTNHPANKKRRRKSQQTVTTVAFHRDGRKYLALSMHESCVQNIWSIMEMPTIIMKANAGTAKATSATKTHELNDDTNHDQPPPRRRAYTIEKGPYPQAGGKNDLKTPIL
jgi:hypothetical protein